MGTVVLRKSIDRTPFHLEVRDGYCEQVNLLLLFLGEGGKEMPRKELHQDFIVKLFIVNRMNCTKENIQFIPVIFFFQSNVSEIQILENCL